MFHHQFPLTNQQLINQLVINLLFAGLQFSHLEIGGLVDSCTVPLVRHFTLNQIGVSTLGVSGETLKFIEISRKLQYTTKSQNWSPKTPKSVQNDVQTST